MKNEKKKKLNISTVGKKTFLSIATILALQSTEAQQISSNKDQKHLYEIINNHNDYGYTSIWDSKLTTLELYNYDKEKDNLPHLLNRKERQTESLSIAYYSYCDEYFKEHFASYANQYTVDSFIKEFKKKEITTEKIDEFNNICFYSFISKAFTNLNTVRHGSDNNNFEWKKSNVRKAIKNTPKTISTLNDIENKILSFYSKEPNNALVLKNELNKLKVILSSEPKTTNTETLAQINTQINHIADMMSKKIKSKNLCQGLISELASQYQTNNTLVIAGKLKNTSTMIYNEDTIEIK